MYFASSTMAEFLQWPIDWPLLSLIAALFALESFSSGSTRTSAISISFPLTYMFTQWLPHTFGIGPILQQISDPVSQAGLFLAVLIAFYFVTHRMIFSFGSAGGSVVTAVVDGLCTAVIVAIFWIMTPGLRELWSFGPTFQMVFGEAYRAYWLMLSFGALAYTRG